MNIPRPFIGFVFLVALLSLMGSAWAQTADGPATTPGITAPVCVMLPATNGTDGRFRAGAGGECE